ncbi:MAG: copper resistance protein B [Sphingomonas sp.]
MRGLPRLLALGLAANAASAPAQSLSYQDVLAAEHAVGPLLSYQPMETGAMPVGAATAAITEAAGPVRAAYFDRIEWQGRRGGDGWSWDLSGEVGSQRHRLWLATAGDAEIDGRLSYVEGQALYSHPILAAGLAVQAGLRYDFVRPRRAHAALGLQGNLNEPLYVGAFGFLSTQGDLTGRAYAYYNWEPLPRLVLQPYAGMELAAHDIPALDLGRGPTSAELSLRIRYRISEPFSPYVGISWDRLLGRTARIARTAGEELEATSLILGIRSYF